MHRRCPLPSRRRRENGAAFGPGRWIGLIGLVLGAAPAVAGDPPCSSADAFGPPASVVVPDEASRIVVAHVDGDATLDLVVTSRSANAVTVFLGDGAGGFAFARELESEVFPNDAVVKDFDGDGIADLAVVRGISDDLSVRRGRGDGTFEPEVVYETGNTPFYMNSGDFDGDGVLDLITANRDSRDISVFRGGGDGTFELGRLVDVGQPVGSVAVADVDADGDPDMVLSVFPLDVVRIYLNAGDATFDRFVDVPAGDGPGRPVVAEVTGDGILDVVVSTSTDPDGARAMGVLAGRGDGMFEDFATGAVIRLSPIPDFLYDHEVADVDGDGRADVVVTFAQLDRIIVGWGLGDGRFDFDSGFAAENDPTDLSVADLDGDGRPDIAYGSDDGSGGEFVTIQLNRCRPPCPGDVDGSGAVGFEDLVAVLSAWGPCPTDPPCPADLDGDGVVGLPDVLATLAAWGPCPG